MRKKVLEQEFIRLNADYKALLDETIQLREKVATADEALEKMRATEENVRSIHENTRRLKHDIKDDNIETYVMALHIFRLFSELAFRLATKAKCGFCIKIEMNNRYSKRFQQKLIIIQ